MCKEIYANIVKDFTLLRLQQEAKSFTFIRKELKKHGMPFPCPYLDAIEEEIIHRFDVKKQLEGAPRQCG